MIYVSQHYNLPAVTPFAKKIMSTNNFQLIYCKLREGEIDILFISLSRMLKLHGEIQMLLSNRLFCSLSPTFVLVALQTLDPGDTWKMSIYG